MSAIDCGARIKFLLALLAQQVTHRHQRHHLNGGNIDGTGEPAHLRDGAMISNIRRIHRKMS
jgi:hypothetical protein